ncbi:phytanoyl-CoA dioxygenase family protein [Rhodococcus erythropolis]|uniref:phytanoyl-CoA dioxygenase family protein n=1 Tax=Rhodococcus erythropolis TaxID=1833 RepID=UPI001BE5E814|nr:phytanoyl-CoA dioxygenase family protein [Rhodococcus erythropolis]MBT2263450.1 phytanoyl-CoA dioxygenase family protein [Rhodococcus erythropolis]
MKTETPSSLRSVTTSTPIEDILAIVAEDGGVIIKNFLSADQIARFNADIEEPMAALAPGSTHALEMIADFHGANTKRLTNLVTHSKTFREEILEQDLLHVLCDATFLEESGTYWMTTAQVIEIGPGNKAQMLHRDLENWYPFIGMGPSGPEVAVNFMIAFTDYTEENGATRVIPGSHRWDDFEDRGTPADTIPATMEAGDAFFYSGKTVHGGGANVTADQYRRGVAFALNPGFLTGEEAYPFLVDMEIAKQLSPRVQRILGFRSQYPIGSPGLWQVDYSELGDYLAL